VPGQPIRIGPSILSADFLRLGEQIAAAQAAGADYIHVDVMDGRFVPNISVGVPVVEAARRGTMLPLDVHLMIVEPDLWIERFARAGADVITVHAEATHHLYALVRQIEEAGATPSVTLNPGTPLVMLEAVIPIVRQALIMCVSPGFGGQTLIPASIDRVRRLRATLDERNPSCVLQVDGGIKTSNVGRLIEAGADSIVAGSAIFKRDKPVAETMADLRRAATEAAARRTEERR
ncbi:MAG TPA: ribulose-phosphate 3-epimerase, partial [Thermomicrobiales bacterium]|nr:ribulose-phosphate 3-epimerase [Thermomicrobiales bacterium]